MKKDGRYFYYGVVTGDLPVDIAQPSTTTRVKIRRRGLVADERRVTAIYPPFLIVDPLTKDPHFVPLHYDQHDTYTQLAATFHRLCREMPVGQEQTQQDFLIYAKAFIDTHVDVPRWVDGADFATTLSKQSYPGWRQRLLTLHRRAANFVTAVMLVVGSFTKDESYLLKKKKNPTMASSPVQPPKLKNARMINARSDFYKTAITDCQMVVDKSLFTGNSAKWFVKGTNPRDWPGRLRDLFGDRPVLETDFTSFEAHHEGVFAEIVHYWLSRAATRGAFPAHYREAVERVVLGTNECQASRIKYSVKQRLMSGEMWTSSANGLLNLLIMSYLNARTLNPTAQPDWLAVHVERYFTGLVEGDDGICLDRLTSQEQRASQEQLIERLGVNLKFERELNFGRAAFCGNVCDIDDLKVVADPLKFLQTFFVYPSKLRDAPLKVIHSYTRCKAMSMRVALNNAPVIGPVCAVLCDLTRDCDVKQSLRHFDAYKRELIATAFEERVWMHPPGVTDKARHLVAAKFGVSVDEQLRIERAFTSLARSTLSERQATLSNPIPLDLDEYVTDESMWISRMLISPSHESCRVPKSRRHVPQWLHDIYRNRGHALETRVTDPLNDRWKRYSVALPPDHSVGPIAGRIGLTLVSEEECLTPSGLPPLGFNSREDGNAHGV